MQDICYKVGFWMFPPHMKNGRREGRTEEKKKGRKKRRRKRGREGGRKEEKKETSVSYVVQSTSLGYVY